MKDKSNDASPPSDLANIPGFIFIWICGTGTGGLGFLENVLSRQHILAKNARLPCQPLLPCQPPQPLWGYPIYEALTLLHAAEAAPTAQKYFKTTY